MRLYMTISATLLLGCGTEATPADCGDGWLATGLDSPVCIESAETSGHTQAEAAERCADEGGRICTVRDLDAAVFGAGYPLPEVTIATGESSACAEGVDGVSPLMEIECVPWGDETAVRYVCCRGGE